MSLQPVQEASAVDQHGNTVLGSVDQTPIEFGSRKYLKPEQLAAKLNISTRTLLRWDAHRVGPPRCRIGKLVLYDIEKLPEWLERFETQPVRASAEHGPRRNR